jgi:hypothetical protein
METIPLNDLDVFHRPKLSIEQHWPAWYHLAAGLGKRAFRKPVLLGFANIFFCFSQNTKGFFYMFHVTIFNLKYKPA